MDLRATSVRGLAFLPLLAAAATACGAGAGSEGLIEVATPVMIVGQPQRTLAVIVQAGQPDYQPEAGAVAAQLLPALAYSGLFLQVVDGSTGATTNPPPQAVLTVIVVDVKRVSSGDRTMWGNMAGQARVTLQVYMVDTATGGDLGAGAVAGLATGGINGGTTDDAIVEAVRQLVWFLAGHGTPLPPP